MQQQLIAHRGWQSRYPENSRESILGAIEVGAQHIEVDIQLSKDRIPVLFHDRTLERICNRNGAIHDYTLNELQQFSIAEKARFGERFNQSRIVTLQELVDWVAEKPDLSLYVEIKRNSLEQFGVADVYSAIEPILAPISSQLTVISFSLEALSYARQAGSFRIGPVLETWTQLESDQLLQLNPDLIFCDSEIIPPGYDLRQLPAPVAIYEISDRTTAQQLIDRGASWIETFRIGELLEVDRR